MTKQEGNTLRNQYFLRKLIAIGRTADVYLAWDQKRQTKLAIKLLRYSAKVNADSFRRIEHEAALITRLEHPHIARLYEVDRDGSLIFLVMDWVEGESLRHSINKNKTPFSLGEVSRILGDQCSALHYAQKTNIVHGNLKPENILLHNDGRVLLTDFRLSSIEVISTAEESIAYLAPEQLPYRLDTRQNCAQTDVYALGVILYEMLSGGYVPYRCEKPDLPGETMRERLAWEIINTPLTPIKIYYPNIPEALDQVIKTALSVNPSLRFSTALELRDAFMHANESLHTGTQFKSSPSSMLRPVPLRRPEPSPFRNENDTDANQSEMATRRMGGEEFLDQGDVEKPLGQARKVELAYSSPPKSSEIPQPSNRPAEPSRAARPSPQAPVYPPRTSHTIRDVAPTQVTQSIVKRYGRIEYFSPMEMEQEYPLRVGLLLDRHGRKLLEKARVRWTTLSLASGEEEPLIRVTPRSGFLRISPPMRDIRVMKFKDVFAEFQILPVSTPRTSEQRCNLFIDFEYRGELIHHMCLDVNFEQKYKLGPIHIPHFYRRHLSLITGAVATFDLGASLYRFLGETSSTDIFSFIITLAIAIVLIGISLVLWRKAAHKVRIAF